MSRFDQFVQQHAEHPSIGLKMINWAAAVLGVGTFLQLVNLAVGVLSAIWLTAQLYGYIRYELPHKRARLALAEKEVEESRQ